MCAWMCLCVCVLCLCLCVAFCVFLFGRRTFISFAVAISFTRLLWLPSKYLLVVPSSFDLVAVVVVVVVVNTHTDVLANSMNVCRRT